MTSSPLLRAGFPYLTKDDISGSIHPRANGSTLLTILSLSKDARGFLETVIMVEIKCTRFKHLKVIINENPTVPELEYAKTQAMRAVKECDKNINGECAVRCALPTLAITNLTGLRFLINNINNSKTFQK
ncbi:MAG: hypothetical protein US53_C0050G0004 [Candidatus Woesebacteria bacterium GW2011_GWA1_37_7]|uniref:Uncharacterized protein n=1 Tax=Candidatus Woesebacteria bacterium GW2011_GWA1_37_7 TaxID=1618545 RepID=A0A0G0H2T2_9BACT|nr:MAG: hypothetical protein US53_C0050G0004 [Candidatus Woesebacteria bacterium GW2011_GWA1_37_7]